METCTLIQVDIKMDGLTSRYTIIGGYISHEISTRRSSLS